jgi:hypothetical protein
MRRSARRRCEERVGEGVKGGVKRGVGVVDKGQATMHVAQENGARDTAKRKASEKRSR